MVVLGGFSLQDKTVKPVTLLPCPEPQINMDTGYYEYSQVAYRWHVPFIQRWVKAGPASTTLAQFLGQSW